jgi:sRNA-binding regulator protein Hfq
MMVIILALLFNITITTTNERHIKDTDSINYGQQRKYQKEKKRVLSATVYLCNGEKLYGDIIISKDASFEIVHKKNDIFYKKKIYLKDVKSIEVLEWKYILINQDKENNIYYYKFLPKRIRIVLSDESIYEYEGYIDIFSKFFFTTKYGTAILYMLFYDGYNLIKGYWINAKKKGFLYHKTNGLTTAVYKIEFDEKSKK